MNPERLKKRVIELEKELYRKEKALAEATALLILKKKLEDVMMEHEDDRLPKKIRHC